MHLRKAIPFQEEKYLDSEISAASFMADAEQSKDKAVLREAIKIIGRLGPPIDPKSGP